MKRFSRLISLMIVSIMVLTLPCISYAAEAEPFDLSKDAGAEAVNTAAVYDDESADDESDKYDTDVDAAKDGGDSDNDYDTAYPAVGAESAGEGAADDDAASGDDADAAEASGSDEDADPAAELTDVTVVGSVQELAEESQPAGNKAFFTIDVSKKKAPKGLATEEVTEDVADILSGKGSTQGKKTAVSDALESSGFYQAEAGKGSKVKVTSEFAYMRLRLDAGKADRINAYGASDAVFYDSYYLLSYDSEEATKAAYEALIAEYGEDSVLIDAPLKLNSSAQGWGTEFMGMDYEQVKAEDGSEVTVAVIDSGVTASHEIFEDTEFVDAYDFVNKKSGSAKDDNGHGTSVAGIIAESTSSNVKIMPLKVLDSKGNGSSANLLMAIEYAEDNGADIINLSMGDYVSDASMAYYENVFADYSALIICSAGNDKKNLDADSVNEFPGELSSTVCVSSIDSEKNRSSFSNYGSMVDFTAPGSSVKIARLSGYASGSGTSYSAPYITAAAALKMVEYEDLDNDDIVDLLKSASEDLGSTGRDVYFGDGCPVFDKSASASGGDISGSYITDFESKISYTGSEITQSPLLMLRGNILSEGSDYTVSYTDNIDVGTAYMEFTGEGIYSGSFSLSFSIKKAANDLKVSSVTAKVKRSKLTGSPVTLARSKVMKVSGGQGEMSYEKVRGSGYLKIDASTGDVTVKKGTGKGTYKMTVKVSASGDENYKAASRNVTVSVRVK